MDQFPYWKKEIAILLDGRLRVLFDFLYNESLKDKKPSEPGESDEDEPKAENVRDIFMSLAKEPLDNKRFEKAWELATSYVEERLRYLKPTEINHDFSESELKKLYPKKASLEEIYNKIVSTKVNEILERIANNGHDAALIYIRLYVLSSAICYAIALAKTGIKLSKGPVFSVEESPVPDKAYLTVADLREYEKQSKSVELFLQRIISYKWLRKETKKMIKEDVEEYYLLLDAFEAVSPSCDAFLNALERLKDGFKIQEGKAPGKTLGWTFLMEKLKDNLQYYRCTKKIWDGKHYIDEIIFTPEHKTRELFRDVTVLLSSVAKINKTKIWEFDERNITNIDKRSRQA